MNKKEWAIQVKIALLQHDMTQAELAKQIGVSRTYLNGQINFTRDYNRTVVNRIADILGIQIGEEGITDAVQS